MGDVPGAARRASQLSLHCGQVLGGRRLPHRVARVAGVARIARVARPGHGGAGPSAVAPSQVPAGSLEEIERASILKALETTRWNKQAAAALLGLRRPTLYSKMRKHGIPQRRA